MIMVGMDGYSKLNIQWQCHLYQCIHYYYYYYLLNAIKHTFVFVKAK